MLKDEFYPTVTATNYSLGASSEMKMVADWLSNIPNDSPVAVFVFAKMSEVVAELKKLIAVENTPDVMKSQLAIDLAIEKQKSTLNSVFIANRLAIKERIDLYNIEETNKRLANSKMIVDEYASEVRTAFRELTYEDKLKALIDATRLGDGAVMAALVMPKVPSLLTGLTKNEQTLYFEGFLESWSSSYTTYIDGIKENVDAFFTYVATRCQPSLVVSDR